jgi:hypothetical protein
MKNEIEKHLNNINLDIRKTNNGRFFDQKVQPDILSDTCQCILESITSTTFTSSDVRDCSCIKKLVRDVYNKPSIIDSPKEYDKLFSQQLKMLSYAGILSVNKKGNINYYTIQNQHLLNYISLRDRFALKFMEIYLQKVLKDSEIFHLFESYFKLQTKESFEDLKNKYIKFIIDNTGSNTETEVLRIFHPLVKVLCFSHSCKRLVKGQMKNVYFNDLIYNQPNWRDINKDKNISRKEFNEKFQEDTKSSSSYKHAINKSKRLVKSIHKYSEIHRFDAYPATQAHHIFLSSQFPELADVPENIIAITPNQHFYRSHPNNKTSVLDKSYQAICLISKLDSIEIDYRNSNGQYSKEKFIDVVNVGLEQDFNYTIDFEELKHEIIKSFL